MGVCRTHRSREEELWEYVRTHWSRQEELWEYVGHTRVGRRNYGSMWDTPE